jgi:hypothetical protein
MHLGNGPALLAVPGAGADRTVVSGGGSDLTALAHWYRQGGLAEMLRALGLRRLDLL